MDIIVSLIFPSGLLLFLKMHRFLSFHIDHMIIPGVSIQQRFTSSFSLFFPDIDGFNNVTLDLVGLAEDTCRLVP
jgi:hypothetical protein